MVGFKGYRWGWTIPHDIFVPPPKQFLESFYSLPIKQWDKKLGAGFSYKIRGSSHEAISLAAMTLIFGGLWHTAKLFFSLSNSRLWSCSSHWTSLQKSNYYLPNVVRYSGCMLHLLFHKLYSPNKYIVKPNNLNKGWALYIIAPSGKPKKCHRFLLFFCKLEYTNRLPIGSKLSKNGFQMFAALFLPFPFRSPILPERNGKFSAVFLFCEGLRLVCATCTHVFRRFGGQEAKVALDNFVPAGMIDLL